MTKQPVTAPKDNKPMTGANSVTLPCIGKVVTGIMAAETVKKTAIETGPTNVGLIISTCCPAFLHFKNAASSNKHQSRSLQLRSHSTNMCFDFFNIPARLKMASTLSLEFGLMQIRSKNTSSFGFHRTKLAMETTSPVKRLQVDHGQVGQHDKRLKPGKISKAKSTIIAKAATVPKSIEGKALYKVKSVSTFCQRLPCHEWDQNRVISSLLRLLWCNSPWLFWRKASAHVSKAL